MRKRINRKIMSATPAYDERMDERFEANIPDVFELYLNTSLDVAYCKVDDFRMIGPNIALATIYVVSPECHWQMDEDIIRNLDRYVHDLFEGTDYGADAISVEPSNSMIADEVLRANDLDYDYDEDYDYGEYIAQVEVWSTEHDDFADDAYFNASRKIGKKRPVTASRRKRITSNSYIKCSSKNIPERMIALGAILRDYYNLEKVNDTHDGLVSIADTMYNANIEPEYLKSPYKEMYNQYGADYFKKVMNEMVSIDNEIGRSKNRNGLLEDLVDEYIDYCVHTWEF